MLFYGQEMLTYKSFDFPVPPPIDWSLAQINSGLVKEVTDLIFLRTNRNATTSGLSGNYTSILSADQQNKV